MSSSCSDMGGVVNVNHIYGACSCHVYFIKKIVTAAKIKIFTSLYKYYMMLALLCKLVWVQNRMQFQFLVRLAVNLLLKLGLSMQPTSLIFPSGVQKKAGSVIVALGWEFEKDLAQCRDQKDFFEIGKIKMQFLTQSTSKKIPTSLNTNSHEKRLALFSSLSKKVSEGCD